MNVSHHLSTGPHDNKMNISQINSVRIGISDVCNLRCPGCPITILPAGSYLDFKWIKKVIDELIELEYEGDIGFHRYNEPLIDPRIWNILDINPFHVVIYTNGTTLTDSVRNRLSNYDLEIVFTDHTLKQNKLDPRLNIYNWEQVEFTRCGRENQLTINHKGNMVICCYDWKDTVTFGNIKEEKLEDMLEKVPYLPREFDICLRCNNWGGEIKTEIILK